MTEARGGKRSNKKQPPLYNEVGLANHFKTAEAPMDDLSLAHSRYNCTYHIVFIPKYRRKVMFGELRKEIGEITTPASSGGLHVPYKGRLLAAPKRGS